MATRSIRGRRIVEDSCSDESNSEDELPDLRHISTYKLKAVNLAPTKSIGTPVIHSQPAKSPVKSTVRRRKLGSIADNPLLRPLGDASFLTPATTTNGKTTAKEKATTPQRIELRTRKTQPTSLEVDDFSEAGSIHEETILEDFSGSDFEASQSSSEEEGDDDDDDDGDAFIFKDFVQPSPSKQKGRQLSRDRKSSPSPSAQLLAEATEAEQRNDTQRLEGSKGVKTFDKRQLSTVNDLARPLSKIQM